MVQGTSNRLFDIRLDNGVELVAKLPFVIAGPAHLTTASEVATMLFAREVLDRLVPRIYTWCSRAEESDVGSEYIIMEKVPGVQLFDRWTNIREGVQTIIQDVVNAEEKMTNTQFGMLGSLDEEAQRLAKIELRNAARSKTYDLLTEEQNPDLHKCRNFEHKELCTWPYYWASRTWDEGTVVFEKFLMQVCDDWEYIGASETPCPISFSDEQREKHAEVMLQFVQEREIEGLIDEIGVQPDGLVAVDKLDEARRRNEEVRERYILGLEERDRERSCINAGVHAQLESSTFSFRSPSVANDVWPGFQDAPDSVCEEYMLVGDHVLRNCFLSLMLKRGLARPNGFFATVRDLVLSPEVYAVLVTKGGLQWCGPSARPAAEAFLIFVAALHTSFADYADVLNWFRAVFLPLLRAAEEAYLKHTKLEQNVSPDTYARALDLLAQIKVIQSQWATWTRDDGPIRALSTTVSLPKLIWNASSLAGTMTELAIAPVLRFAGNTIRASVPLKWIRYCKATETLRPNLSKRRASSVLDPRPYRALNSEPEGNVPNPETTFASAPVFTRNSPLPPVSPRLNASQATVPVPPPSNVRPFRYSVSAGPKASPAPIPLRLPRKASYGLRETPRNEGVPVEFSRRDFS
ncbi:hypothetical protein B0H17DRAFT_1327423 [Mycena rosella]|uniref:Altered inheritance of mitochondria protein 9, mitochondrial n=1 Tax=Mycena rosella TaxID=1033263 RepID=A0AAD7GPR5_MYCRO|nr:hypothetical protein B0H17DRAFT_1327423 [Mycena rosella]